MPKPKGDILDSIFDLIGTPGASDSQYISDEIAQNYIKKFKPRAAMDFKAHFPEICPAGIELAKSLLEFNPYFRASAE